MSVKRKYFLYTLKKMLNTHELFTIINNAWLPIAKMKVNFQKIKFEQFFQS